MNFGHFGGDDFWLEFSTTGKNARIAKIYEMMTDPNWKVYGDFSFNLEEEELFDKFRSEMDANPDIAKRNLYGTDYWVVLPAGELLKDQEKFLRKLHNHKNAMLKENVLEYLIG